MLYYYVSTIYRVKYKQDNFFSICPESIDYIMRRVIKMGFIFMMMKNKIVIAQFYPVLYLYETEFMLIII